MKEETIKNFLNQPEIFEAIKEANKARIKIFIKIFLITLFGVCFYIFILYNFPDLRKLLSEKGSIFLLPLFGVVLAVTYYYQLIKHTDPRRNIINKLAPLIDKNLFYEFKSSVIPKWINDTRLVQPFDRISRISNHIKYITSKTKGSNTSEVVVEGFEIVTSKKNEKNEHVITCDAFITEISFSGNRFDVRNDVRVYTEPEDTISDLEDFFSKDKTKVKLESNDFEKMFDVYCDDQIEARDLLNPHTMEALMHFVRSLPYKRNYAFLFTGHSIFVRYYFNRKESLNRKLKWHEFSGGTGGNRSKIFGDMGLLKSFRSKDIYTEFYEEFTRFKNFVEDFDPFYRP